MRAISVAVTVLLLCGCSELGTATGTTTTGTPSKLTIAPRAHEYPSAAPAQSAAGGTSTPAAAVAAFASSYINWSASTVAAQMHSLAAESVGQARSAMQLAAAQTANDYELRRGGIANSGTVEAVAPRAAHPGQYIVVTLERTTASASSAYQGLNPAWHVAIATAMQLRPGGWVVSGWQPES